MDLACGSGLSAVEFTKANYQVLGVNVSESLIGLPIACIVWKDFMYQWEYKTIKFYAQGAFNAGRINEIELEDTLNELGARGWELVTILPGTRANGELWDFVAILKREVNS